MSFWKDLLAPIVVNITVTITIAFIGFRYLEHKNFLENNSRKELADSYKSSNISLAKSLNILSRIQKETENTAFIQSDYFLNQIDDAIETNGDFLKAQLVIEIYGDSISKPIFNTVAKILKEIDEDLFRYKRRRELLKESTANICNSRLNKRDKTKNRHLNHLKRIIAEENYLRTSLPVRHEELSCLKAKIIEDFKRFSQETYDPKIYSTICLEEFKQDYSRHYNSETPFFEAYLDFNRDELPLMHTDKERDSIDAKYGTKIVRLSLEACY